MRMSARGLVRFMTSSPAAQRKVLRDYKYPEPEGVAQASYYRDVMDVIERYHGNGSASSPTPSSLTAP